MKPSEGEILVRVARQGIKSIFSGEKVEVPGVNGSGGVFVTLVMEDGEVKGSMGMPYLRRPLGEAVLKVAKLAAFSENKLKQSELDNVIIEVSILSEPKLIKIKNFAIRGDGSLIPIDFENTNIYNEDFHISNPEKFIDASFRSLSVLFGSLNKEGNPQIDFYVGFTGEALWEMFDRTVFSAYRNSYEERILSMADSGSLDVNQFSQSLDNLEQIREKIRERVLTPVSSSHQ